MSGLFIGVRNVVIVPIFIIQHWKGVDPLETGCFRNYDLSDNWIINDHRQRAEDFGLENPSSQLISGTGSAT